MVSQTEIKESSLDSIPKTPEEAREKKELAKQKESFQVQNGSEVVEVVEAGERSPLSDAPLQCIYCGKETNDIFVILEDF